MVLCEFQDSVINFKTKIRKITPNMTNDGHDTNITFASSWERDVITPLLSNTYFMNNTLVLLTYDETETYTKQNKIFSILLGGAIPGSLKGTTDDTFYNHYSSISSVAVNWGLPSLGRWDCEANVFALIANKTNFINAAVDTTHLYFNSTYPGPLSNRQYIPSWPAPETTAKCASGLGVLGAIKNTWANTKPTYNYTNVYPYDLVSGNNGPAPSGNNPNVGGTKSSLSTGAKAGIGVGVALGIVILAVIVFLLTRRWRRKRSSNIALEGDGY